MASEVSTNMSEANSFKAQHYRPIPPDFKITIDGFEFNVHRKVLEKDSGFFKALFRNVCAESNTNSITLHDDNTLAVARFISCTYFGYYDDDEVSTYCLTVPKMLKEALVDKDNAEKLEELLASEGEEGQDESEDLQWKVRLYLLADKYDCDHLMSSTLDNMIEMVRLSGVLDIWDIVDSFHLHDFNRQGWKRRVDDYLETYVEEHLEHSRMHDWMAGRDLVGRMMKAAYQEGKEAR